MQRSRSRAGPGGAVVDAASGGQIGRAAGVPAPGLLVMAIILFMGTVSGAHLNPAVTLAFALRGDFPWRRVPGYVVVQLVAAAAACLLLRLLFGNVGGLRATLPGAGFTDLQAVVVELLLTLGLLSTILGTASTAQNVGPLSALAVGGYIVLAGLWSSPVSGASVNPARSLGPAVVNGDFGAYWVYLAGPILGAAVAVGVAVLLRGRGGDAGGRAAARGDLGTADPGPEAVPAPRPRKGKAGIVHPPARDRMPPPAFTRFGRSPGPGSALECRGATTAPPRRGRAMTTIDRAAGTRRVYFHDPAAPVATRVVPSVFVAVRSPQGSLLLVRRCDSGAWELPGGRVDVGECAVETAVRETAEETGVQVTVTGFVGLFTDPGHVVRAADGEVRQQFAVLFRARAVGGSPRGDRHETSEAAWVAPTDLPGLSMESPVRIWVARALAVGEPAHLG